LDFFLCAVGIIFIIEGLPYFVFPEKLKEYLVKISAMPESTLRFIGITAIIIGMILLYMGRR